jgi:heme/copper-type cytochrome/quinol oxidase subunit 1
VRSALLYLGVGFLIGAVMLFEKGIPLQLASPRMLPMHVEFVLIGWTLQLAMGVAFWILPRFSREPRYGHLRYGWLAFVLLNIGVLCAGTGQWLAAPPPLVVGGRVAELLAVIFFALQAWPRIKPAGA